MVVFRADTARLGKYCTGGYGRIGVYRVNVLVDTSAQIEVTKGPERGQIELSKLSSQHFCYSNNCMSMDVTMGGQYGGHFKRR